MPPIHLTVPEEQLSAFLAYLGIGTLTAIREGMVPPDAGIWTMGMPHTWTFLKDHPLVDQRIVAVYQGADELSLLQEVAPEQFHATVSDLISQLQQVLTKMEDPRWTIDWKVSTTSWIPVKLLSSHGHPRSFATVYDGNIYFFRSSFDAQLNAYESRYRIRIIGPVDEQELSNITANFDETAFPIIGDIPINQTLFDWEGGQMFLDSGLFASITPDSDIK